MGWGWHVQGMNNRIHHAIQVLQHVFIGKAHYAETLRKEKVPAVFVSLTFVLCAVGRPINFDNEAFSETHKINHKAINRSLLAKSQPHPFELSKPPPELAFGARSVSAKSPRNFVGHQALSVHAPHPYPSPSRGGELFVSAGNSRLASPYE